MSRYRHRKAENADGFHVRPRCIAIAIGGGVTCASSYFLPLCVCVRARGGVRVRVLRVLCVSCVVCVLSCVLRQPASATGRPSADVQMVTRRRNNADKQSQEGSDVAILNPAMQV